LENAQDRIKRQKLLNVMSAGRMTGDESTAQRRLILAMQLADARQRRNASRVMLLSFAVIAIAAVHTSQARYHNPGLRLDALAILAACGVVTLLVVALTLLATAGEYRLPAIMQGNGYRPALTVVITIV
jgi:hypothetical protein